MPRPKPQKPLIVRSVKLTAKGWATFDRLGGSAWLRGQMRTRVALEHNIRKALANKTPHLQIAKDLGISTKTIQSVWRHLLQCSELNNGDDDDT